MKRFKKSMVSAFMLAVLAFVPASAYAIGDGVAEPSEQAVPMVVYDKADFYEEAADGSAVMPRSRARASVVPMYLSDEMKYFAKYESSCNYDQGFSYGDDYHALGYYQFDHRYGLQDFLLACYDYDPVVFYMFEQFEDIPSDEFRYYNSATTESAIRCRTYNENTGKWTWGYTELGNNLNAAWHAAYAADPSLFSALQDGWAYASYFVPAKNYLESIGIDITERADCVQGLCWGMCNLFGSGGWKKFVTGSGVNDSMTDIEFVTALCTYVVDKVGEFYPNQPQYHQGWQNRYRKELNYCLSVLPEEGKWVFVEGHWKYLEGDTYRANSWLMDKGDWYWLDAEGNAAQGKTFINGSWYWFASDCSMCTDSWKQKNDLWTYVGSSGVAKVGWAQIDGQWYYFNSEAVMLTGRIDVSGSTYFLAGSGEMLNGWIDTDEGRFYCRASGEMVVGWYQFGGLWYYFGQTGAMTVGWLKDGGIWYYLDPAEDGAMATGWIEDGGERYYLRSSGAMATGWIQKDEVWYYLRSSGAMATGWVQAGGVWYWFDATENSAMATGWRDIDGVRYYFKSSGAMATGWIQKDEVWYYLASSGALVKNQWVEGCYVNSEGKWVELT